MAGRPKTRAKREAEARANTSLMVIPVPEPEPEPKDRFGRKTKFRPEFVAEALVLCEEGATNPELAEHFGVAISTILLWGRVHPEFGEVLRLGKRAADDRAERTLYELAVGFTMTVTEHIKLRQPDGSEIVATRTRDVNVPPDRDALKFWLKNRKGDDWKERTEKHVTGSAEVVHLTYEQVQERVRAMLAELKQQQLGNQ